MSLAIAIKVLEHYQRWREGIEPEMINHNKLTQALDVIIKHAKNTQYANV
jgi:hypothetical protein